MGTLKRGGQLGLVMAGMAFTLAAAASGGMGSGSNRSEPHVAAGTAEEAGRYLVVAGGCNDCHTPGWNESNGNVPEADWLAGGFSRARPTSCSSP